MNHEERNLDQRKSYRCPVADEQQAAELKIGRRRFRVRLFNESSGGFGAVSVDKLDAAPGDVVQLIAPMGRCEVRVAFIRAVELPEQDGGTLYRIGLERLGDAEPTDKDNVASPVRLLTAGGGSHVPVLLIGLFLVLASVGYFVLTGSKGKWGLSTGNAALSQPAHSAALSTVIRQVGLTRVQQVQLQQIASQAAQALQEIDQLWKDDTPEDRQVKQALLLEATKQEIFGLLTEEQRARWKALVK